MTRGEFEAIKVAGWLRTIGEIEYEEQKVSGGIVKSDCHHHIFNFLERVNIVCNELVVYHAQ